MHTSQDFFLLWASHVVKLDGRRLEDKLVDKLGLTNPDECTGLCPNICRDEKEVGLARPEHYKCDTYLHELCR